MAPGNGTAEGGNVDDALRAAERAWRSNRDPETQARYLAEHTRAHGHHEVIPYVAPTLSEVLRDWPEVVREILLEAQSGWLRGLTNLHDEMYLTTATTREAVEKIMFTVRSPGE
jgi:hypothetical protein